MGLNASDDSIETLAEYITYFEQTYNNFGIETVDLELRAIHFNILHGYEKKLQYMDNFLLQNMTARGSFFMFRYF